MQQIFCAIVILQIISLEFVSGNQSQVPPCNSIIRCYGDLLKIIQLSHLFNDSKTFPDMKLRYTPDMILENFEKFKENKTDLYNKSANYLFVEENFEAVGNELEEYIPGDWVMKPNFVQNITNEELKDWALTLNNRWKDLSRKIKDNVKNETELYSIIWVPHPFVVPGGRFREFYYWDSYWIVRGLLLCEMVDTVQGMLENFLYLVDKYGHIPNGGRIYYLQRSQPPLLIPMVEMYYEFTKNLSFIKNNINLMEKEFEFWMVNRTKTVIVNDKNYTMALYGENSIGPRPESYAEDVYVATFFTDNNNKNEFYKELKATAESGWDFSSRWCISENKTNEGNLTCTKTRSIIPVDLNAIIYRNAVLLSNFHSMLNNMEKMKYYKEIAFQWREAVENVLWDSKAGIWLDYDMINSMRRNYFYPSNIFPLWTSCYDPHKKNDIEYPVIKYFTENIMKFDGGVPTSMTNTGQQWDYPNAWPPLQHVIISALKNMGLPEAERLAHVLAKKWIGSVFEAYKASDYTSMFEKYDATVQGRYGGGGEYEVQMGFGWTNGIILHLLAMYPNMTLEQDMDSPDMAQHFSDDRVNRAGVQQTLTMLMTLLVSTIGGYLGVCIYKNRLQLFQNKIDNRRSSTTLYKELKNLPIPRSSGLKTVVE